MVEHYLLAIRAECRRSCWLDHVTLVLCSCARHLPSLDKSGHASVDAHSFNNIVPHCVNEGEEEQAAAADSRRREVTGFGTGAGRGIRSGDVKDAVESGSAEQEDAIALVLILAAFSALLACQAGLCCNKRSQHAGEGSNEQRNGGSWLLSAVE